MIEMFISGLFLGFLIGGLVAHREGLQARCREEERKRRAEEYGDEW